MTATGTTSAVQEGSGNITSVGAGDREYVRVG